MNRENYEKLESLVKKINEDILSAKSLLQEATLWNCSNWDERKLFDDLIDRAKEYLKLEEIITNRDYSGVNYLNYYPENRNDLEHDKWKELMGWFGELHKYNFEKLKELFLLH